MAPKAIYPAPQQTAGSEVGRSSVQGEDPGQRAGGNGRRRWNRVLEVSMRLVRKRGIQMNVELEGTEGLKWAREAKHSCKKSGHYQRHNGKGGGRE